MAAALALTATVSVRLAPAHALNFWELEVYPAWTDGKGMLEAELLNSYVPKGKAEEEDGEFQTEHMLRQSLELNYGVTDKIDFAAYLDLAKPDGAHYQYAGSRYRLRGSLFERGEWPIDVGWYAELEWRRAPQIEANELEIDLRPIISGDLGRVSVMLNPIFEKAIFVGPDKNKGFEFNYATKISYRWARLFQPGIEFYGDIGPIDDTDRISGQQHYIFPVIDMQLPGGAYLNFGVGFGLTSTSDNLITKVNLELEHFVGGLF